jgi:hypothetical protein
MWPPVQLDDSPESVRLHREYKRIHQALMRKDDEAALAIADKVFADNPEGYSGLWLKGYVLSATGKSEGASFLEQALENTPFPG